MSHSYGYDGLPPSPEEIAAVGAMFTGFLFLLLLVGVSALLLYLNSRPSQPLPRYWKAVKRQRWFVLLIGLLLVAIGFRGELVAVVNNAGQWLETIRPAVEDRVSSTVSSIMDNEKVKSVIADFPDDMRDTVHKGAAAGVAGVWVGIVIAVGLVIAAIRGRK